jgi:oxaloacetate decarboxylase alpha subunit
MCDDERLLRYMFPADDVDQTMLAKPLKLTMPANGPVVRLIEQLAARPGLAHFELERKGVRIAFSRNAPPRSEVNLTQG